ncbi:MAG: SDR family NAD(P)-dependent oxidoreductase [Phycisphaerales bacterium]
MELAGKVAVVTGASSGIGAATAEALAAAGMRVVAVARRRERLDALAERVPGISAHAADVTSDAEVEALVHRVREEFGACHLLVNNAGSTGPHRFRSADDVDGVRAMMELNFMGVVRCMGAFAPLLVDSAPARVVNVASVAGKIGVGSPAYTASKFAVIGLTEGVGADWARRGITVTQLNPGFIATEGFPQTDLMRSPVTRRLVGSPDLVARAIVAVARSGRRERTVPRWYRGLVVLRHLAAPMFRAAADRLRWRRCR